ncbi:MAG: iron transporter [Thiohalocapsa sp.]
MILVKLLMAAAIAIDLAAAAQAAETAIGKPIERDGMEIGAVYLQAVTMEPMLPGMQNAADIHLEADIHAVKDNKNGFGPGDWIPYLGITYRLAKEGSSWVASGPFMPMVAQDGPHYGANVKLDGPGKYKLSFHILPPPYRAFYRHTDKETGVAEWWAPIDVEWDFVFAGTGKKGAD